MPRRSMANRVVAITGGARGIGYAIAERLATAGARVSLGDVDVDGARSAAATLPTEAFGAELDVRDRPSFTSFLDETEARLGPIDVLVNNAGVMFLGPLHDEDDEATDLMVDINVKGVLLGMKLAAPRMVERRRGHIVNIASMAGKVALAHGVTYATTKHAIVGASDAMRAELHPHGVRVSTVLPSIVDTELAAGEKPPAYPPVASPEDVAQAVLHALERGLHEVTVPRVLQGLVSVAGALTPGGRARLLRWFDGDAAMRDADPDVRASYEAEARSRLV